MKSEVQLLDEDDIEIIKNSRLEEGNILLKFSKFSCKEIQNRKIFSHFSNNFLLSFYINNKPKCILYLDITKAPVVIFNKKVYARQHDIDVRDIINKDS